jgi:hypothetical protein
MLETERRRKGKGCKRLGCVQTRLSSVWHTGLSGGAPDNVRCARLISGELAALGNSPATYNYNSPDCPVSQRSAAQSARDTWPSQRLEEGTRLSGVHRTCPVRQRLSDCQWSTAPFMERNRAPDMSGVHRTVRCARRQKARSAFLDCFQRLLGPLCL